MIDNRYLKGIIANDTEVIEEIYSQCSPKIVSLVMSQGGTLEDARDVFQDGLIIIYKKLSDDSLRLSSKFSTYLYGVCKFVWWKKRSTNKPSQEFNPNLEIIDEENIEEKYIQLERQRLFQKKLEALSPDCRKVLEQFFNGSSGAEIAEKMGYTAEYARRKKYICKEKLVTLIKKDIHYKGLVH